MHPHSHTVTEQDIRMIDLVVGVDGGGSKTRVILADAEGNHLADVTGGGSAMAPGRADHCADVIGELVRQAVQTAEVGQHLKVLVAGVAGVGREPEARALAVALEDLELADEVIVQGDGEIALSDAFGNGPGVMLIAGTGSIAYGRGPSRVLARCGGWGPAFGDEGSGAWIGRKSLGIVASAADGREPET